MEEPKSCEMSETASCRTKLRVALQLIVAGFLLPIAGCENRSAVVAVHGPTNPTVAEQAKSHVRYYGSAIELLPEKEQQYRKLHSDVWPEVLAAIKNANIRNYSIFVAEIGGKRYLFSYFEYHGDDPDRDLASMANDPTTRDKWWPITNACQRRLPGTPEGQQWMPLEQLMHVE
jgi:L-rhamnose mutarotase